MMTTAREFFTEDEFDAIVSAMLDYADYGDKEADIALSISYKIAALFNENP